MLSHECFEGRVVATLGRPRVDEELESRSVDTRKCAPYRLEASHDILRVFERRRRATRDADATCHVDRDDVVLEESHRRGWPAGVGVRVHRRRAQTAWTS